jgi:hypothetical protein
MFQTKAVQKIVTYILCYVIFFLRKYALCEMMWKNMLEWGRPEITGWRTRITCWIPKAINAHIGCVILTDFLLQQWMHERASVLSYTWFTSLVHWDGVFYSHVRELALSDGLECAYVYVQEASLWVGPHSFCQINTLLCNLALLCNIVILYVFNWHRRDLSVLTFCYNFTSEILKFYLLLVVRTKIFDSAVCICICRKIGGYTCIDQSNYNIWEDCVLTEFSCTRRGRKCVLEDSWDIWGSRKVILK